GRIAGKFASDLKLVEDAQLVAVAARDKERAAAFAAQFGAQRSYASYGELVACNDVDIIYVATTHNFHYEHTLLCLHNNKAVLCEKPFGINGRQVKEMIALARHKNIFLMEALWTKFLPQFGRLKEMIAKDMLGEIRNIRADFGFRPKDPVPPRLFDPALGGGSLLDIGIYPVFITLALLGKPDVIEASMSPAHTGVDLQCAIMFKYKNGALAQLFSTNDTDTATEADINGTKGCVRLKGRFHELSAVIEFTPKPGETQVMPFVKDDAGWGYQYEARHAGECLRKGLTESPVMTHQDSIDLIETLDRIRQKAGIYYPADDEK
ncbi:MAG TPA: Gfo/Idh/MocA family oxidoreductase, partial [Chitinophagaceae bacterium]|nr:Gfo/Idh/MocA family oxidoreductase [Chitinophagaceae bacterium]